MLSSRGMNMRKRLTELFPFLLPIRMWQRNVWVQLKMRFDGNHYARKREVRLPYLVSKTSVSLLNYQTGASMEYQYNKVHNLKLASQMLQGLIIEPNEVFSFYWSTRNPKKYGDYKEGLVDIDGKLVAKKGGGVCALTNTLYETFLKSSLHIVERHPHRIKNFPDPKGTLAGCDATIHPGWLDLKVKNESSNRYQIWITFQKDTMTVSIYSDSSFFLQYELFNREIIFYEKDGCSYERASVDRRVNGVEEHLYDNVTKITYKPDLLDK